MLALFTAIEASRNRNCMVSTPSFCSKTDKRRTRELKRLAYSINYKVKGGHQTEVKERERAYNILLNED
jgi:hypothetical protein